MTLRLSGLSSFLMFQRSFRARSVDVFNASEQLATQKRINRPSDDPEGSKIVLNFREALGRMEQYRRNIEVVNRNYTTTESILMEMNDLLQRAKEISIQGNNGTQDETSRVALAEEVQQLQQQLLVLSNTKVNGNFIFSGVKTDTQPYTLDPGQPAATPVATFNGSTTLQSIAINEASTMDTQLNGEEIFLGDGGPDTVDVFQTLANLEVALRDGNTDEADPVGIPQMIDDLDIAIQQTLGNVTSIGSKINRLDRSRDQLLSQESSFKDFISQIEDVDVAEIALEFQRTQTALQATIGSAGAVLSLPSLMDFVGR